MDHMIKNSPAYNQTQSIGRSELPEHEQAIDEQFTQTPKPFTLGMSSFNKADRHQFGQSIRLSMALIEGKATSTPSPRTATTFETCLENDFAFAL